MTSDDYPYWSYEEWWNYYPPTLAWFFLDADDAEYPPADYWDAAYDHHG